MPPTLQAQHIARVEAVNTARSNAARERALQRLEAWREGVFACAGWDASNQGCFLMQADRHYLDQGIDRPMCCGVWLDWKPALWTTEASQCCFIDEGSNERCSGLNEFGGFCSKHDQAIHAAGGDNSPGGSAIIHRSVLMAELRSAASEGSA